MKPGTEIQAMIDRLEDNIAEQGWAPELDGAAKALQWVLGSSPTGFDALVSLWTERPSVDRRREWIARGGDPADWPSDGAQEAPAPDDQLRELLDRHPEVLREFLEREARRNPGWLDAFFETENRRRGGGWWRGGRPD